jgi:ElaB/YqjD/DUF883 family membrane-anchored ribosome-binding protein
MATALKDTTRVEGRNESCGWPTRESVADVVRQTRNTVEDVRQATRDAAEHLELAARRRPLAAVGVAAAAGFVAGSVLAFALGWFAARRVRS